MTTYRQVHLFISYFLQRNLLVKLINIRRVYLPHYLSLLQSNPFFYRSERTSLMFFVDSLFYFNRSTFDYDFRCGAVSISFLIDRTFIIQTHSFEQSRCGLRKRMSSRRNRMHYFEIV